MIARADDHVLEGLVGGEALRLMRALDPDLTRPSVLRLAILDMWSPEELLIDRSLRAHLVDLIPPANAVELARVLGHSGSDPYRYLRKTLTAPGTERAALLLGYFGLPPIPVPAQTEIPPDRSALVPGYGLFDHQRVAARKVTKALNSGHMKVLLHMPTGAGKTRTAMTVIARHLREHEPSVIVWLAHSEELCEQAAAEFEIAWRSLGDREAELGRFWGSGVRQAADLTDGLLVAGFAKIYATLQQDIGFMGDLASRTTLVVMDEAHQAVADTYSLILETLTKTGRTAGLLGLTATPGRTWADIDEDERLSAFFSRQKVGLATGVDNAVDYLIDQGFLARPSFKPLFHDGSIDLTAVDRRAIATGLEIPNDVLRQLAEDDQRNLKIVLEVGRLSQEHQRIIVFAASVKHSKTLALVLNAQGIEAHSVTGDTASHARDRSIRRFREQSDGRVVLCNYGVLTAGFDAPRTSAAVIARPTTSLVLYFQMVGRAMRGPRAGGNSGAEIVTIVDKDLPGFGDMGDAFLNWEDVWEDEQ